jgi:hypothetical protein
LIDYAFSVVDLVRFNRNAMDRDKATVSGERTIQAGRLVNVPVTIVVRHLLFIFQGGRFSGDNAAYRRQLECKSDQRAVQD